MKVFEVQVRVGSERLPQIADELAARSGQPRHRILADLRSAGKMMLTLPDDQETMRALQAEGLTLRPIDPRADAESAWASVLGEHPASPPRKTGMPPDPAQGEPAVAEPTLRAAALWSEAEEKELDGPSEAGVKAPRVTQGAPEAEGTRPMLGASGEDAAGLDQAILSLGPQGEQARRPPPSGAARPGRRPSAWLALLLGLLAPGLGQVYLGAITGGLVVLVCSFLLVPWPLAAVLAARDAARQRRGRAIPDAPARWGVVASWAIFFWLAVFAFVWLVNTPTPLPSRVGEPVLAPASRSLEDVPRPEAPAQPEASGAAPGTLSDEGPVEDEAQGGDSAEETLPEVPRILVDGLIEEATEACDMRDWERCLRLAERALSLDPASRDAMRLRLDAMVGTQEALEREGEVPAP